MPAKSRRLIQEDSSHNKRRKKKRGEFPLLQWPLFQWVRQVVKEWKVNVDGPTLLIIGLLLVVGMLALFTASYPTAYYYSKYSTPLYFVINQGKYMLLGLAGMVFASRVDYHRWAFWGFPLFAISLLLLALVPIIGETTNEATRWIRVGGITIQPSEFMKTAIIVTFSYYGAKNMDHIRHKAEFQLRHKSRYTPIRVCQNVLYHKTKNPILHYLQAMIIYCVGLWPCFVSLVIICLLLAKEPHLSATIIICATGMGILFIAGLRIRYFVPLLLVMPVAIVGYLMSHPYAMTRIRVWLDPFIDYRGKGWQASQSFIAIGSGGLWGLGLGQGRQKQLYLPEPFNDFIFSVVCEEMGFIGAIIVIVLFAALIYRGFHIAQAADDTFGCLVASGLTIKVAIQVLVNLCVVSGVLPVTGAALPFFSYGGTALCVQMFEMGILLNISRNMQLRRRQRQKTLTPKELETKQKAVKR